MIQQPKEAAESAQPADDAGAAVLHINFMSPVDDEDMPYAESVEERTGIEALSTAYDMCDSIAQG